MNTNTILILHGWGIGSKSWDRVRELLESRGYKVFIPDLPGFGENPPPEKPWSADDYVEWVKIYYDKNGLSRIVLVGHSFGGGLAAQFTSKFPQRVEKLILADAAIIRVANAKREFLAKIAKLIKVFSFLPFYGLVRRAFYKFIASDYPGLEGVMRETYLNIVKKDQSDCLPVISVPTLLVWGEKDKITPLKDGKIIKDKIPGAELAVIPDVKHSPHLEAPEILAEKIIKFIND